MVLCQMCGAQQEEGAGFCPRCGSAPPNIAPIAPQALQPQYQQAPQMQSLSQYQQTVQSPYQPAPQQPYPPVPQRQYQGPGQYYMPPAAQPGQEIKKGMAVLCYVPGCVIISLLAARKNPFVRFHINQGLLLFILFIIASMVSSLASYVLLDISLAAAVVVMAIAIILYVMVSVFSLLGIIHAAKGQTKPSPLVGRVKILK